jgi:hypothetical protein
MNAQSIDRSLIGKLLMIVLVIIGLVLGPSTVTAQDASPSITLVDASAEIDAGETSTVTAEYEFNIASAGSGDNQLSSISGTVWTNPDRTIGDITATVNGETAEAMVEEQSRHLDLTVPVSDVSNGDTVTVTLMYEVTGPDSNLRVPLWVPGYSTPGEENVVGISVTLPEGATLSGGAFPSASTVDGNSIGYELLHVPGFVSMEYGQSEPGIVTTDTLYSILGVVVIVSFIIGGLAIDRKTA